MRANPVLMQKKYARVVALFAEREGMPLDDALSFFYGSRTYGLMSEGVSDMHCRSDAYLAEELSLELRERGA